MLSLPASLTVDNALAARASLAEALAREAGPEVILDAAGLQRFDSAALAVLLHCERLASGAGKAFGLRGLPPKLASLATLYGVDRLLAAGAATGTAETLPVDS